MEENENDKIRMYSFDKIKMYKQVIMVHIKRKREIYVLEPKNKQKYKNNSTIRFRKSKKTNGGV